jgi:glutathione S-transferase
MEYTYVSLVTLLVVILNLWFGIKVGLTRGEIKAPATTGSPEFERAQRVHKNTIEQMVVFLPSLWLAVPVFGDLYTALIGCVWLVGRVLYALAYWADKDRSFGFNLTFMPSIVLLIIALYSVISAIL